MKLHSAFTLAFAIGFQFSNANAQTAKWQTYVRNEKIMWQQSGSPVVPAGYNFDMNKGYVTGENYRLEITRNTAGTVGVVSEVQGTEIKSKVEGQKSEHTYQLRRVHFAPDGSLKAITECQGNRTLSSTASMLWSWVSKSDLGNRRSATCNTITPAMCSVLNQSLDTEFGKDFRSRKFAEACETMSTKLNSVYAKIAATLPPGLLQAEKDEVEGVLKRGMKGTPVFDTSALNMTLLLTEIPPEKRIADAGAGFGMFHDMAELEKLCGREKPSASTAKADTKAKGTAVN